MIEFLDMKGMNASFLIQGRESFIKIFAHMAGAINPSFLQNRDNPLIITIGGPEDCGKSLGAEAMINTLIDDGDLGALYTGPKSCMFMEKFPCEGAIGLSNTFNVAGKKTMVLFSSGISFLNREVFHHLDKNPGVIGAAAFGTYYIPENKAYFQPPTVSDWMRFTLEVQPSQANNRQTKWNQKITISALNSLLRNCPRFQERWAALSSLQNTM